MSRNQFVAITGNSKNNLFALDSNGDIWRYIQASKSDDPKPHFAFWTKLTSHRRDPSEERK